MLESTNLNFIEKKKWVHSNPPSKKKILQLFYYYKTFPVKCICIAFLNGAKSF